jgi:hypothetical protein
MSNISHFTIRTSDRRTFRRCLRKWDFQASLRGNWQHKGTEQNINFWFGSAIHFSMEDFHGENKFGDPRKAFWAYYQAFPADELPLGAEANYELGMAMLSYYLTWYKRHNEVTDFKTAYVDPETHTLYDPHKVKKTDKLKYAVEQSFLLSLNTWVALDETDCIRAAYFDVKDLPKTTENVIIEKDDVKYNCHIVPVQYHGTMDKIVCDKYGRYWILDYKTAKGADINKLDTDDQISAYLWAFERWFGIRPYGFIYLQLTKEAVQEPRRLKNGELSVDKKQKTTYSLLKQEIIKDYGSVNSAPAKLIQFLNYMAEQESPEGDRFIRWDFVKRSPEQIESTEQNILGELRTMLWDQLYCYPNPTRDCIWDCPCRDLCLAMDRKDDVAIQEFMQGFEQRPRNEDGNLDPWRENIPWPEKLMAEGKSVPELDEILSLDECMKIELESSASQEETNGFQFMYGDEEDL